MGARELVAIDFEMPDYLRRFEREIGRVQIAIASDLQTNIGLRFDNEGAYNGHEKWKDLASGANRRRAKNGLQERQILRKTGALKNSMSPAMKDGTAGPGGYVRFQGDIRSLVTSVGSGLKYARIHNEGGVIMHPGTQNGFGRGIKIPPHKIKIPRRNFTDWNQTDASNLEKVLKNTVEEILNER